MNVNIFVAGGAILAAAGAVIAGVLAKMTIKEIRHPQRPPREVQIPLPGAQPKDQEKELQHV
jgi:hypothetical protein